MALLILSSIAIAGPRDLKKVEARHSSQEIQNAMVQATFDSVAFALNSGQSVTLSFNTQDWTYGYPSLATLAVNVTAGTISVRRTSNYWGSVNGTIARDSSHVIVTPTDPLQIGQWEMDIPFLGGQSQTVTITAQSNGTAGTAVIQKMRGN